MQQDQEVGLSTESTSQESFVASFTRVPSGLDPSQVYSHFLRLSARVEQLEQQARQTSAPFVLESALREATAVRTEATQAAERTYNEIVAGAEQESGRIKDEARQQADALLDQARTSSDDLRRQADEVLAAARAEAAELLRQAEAQIARDEQDFEQLCANFAGFLQRILDRKAATGRPLVSTLPAVATLAATAESGLGPTAAAEPATAGAEPSQEQAGGSSAAAAAGEPWSAETESAQTSDQADDQPTEALAALADQPAESTLPEAGQPSQEQPSKAPPSRGFRLPSWLDS